MIKSKRKTCYDLQGNERSLLPHEYDRLKKAGVVKDKPSKKEEKQKVQTKEEKTKPSTK
jgi:hypothetical protein